MVKIGIQLYFSRETRKTNLPFASLFQHDGGLGYVSEHPNFFPGACQANLYCCRQICLFPVSVSLSRKLRTGGVLLFYQQESRGQGRGGSWPRPHSQPVLWVAGRIGLWWPAWQVEDSRYLGVNGGTDYSGKLVAHSADDDRSMGLFFPLTARSFKAFSLACFPLSTVPPNVSQEGRETRFFTRWVAGERPTRDRVARCQHLGCGLL